MNKQSLRETRVKNIKEALNRIMINPGYETAWFNKKRTELINGDRTDGLISELEALFSERLEGIREKMVNMKKSDEPKRNIVRRSHIEVYNKAVDDVLQIIDEEMEK